MPSPEYLFGLSTVHEMIPLEELSSFAVIMCLGIFTQAAAGFAAGLVIMPLMLWAGHGIPEAQAAVLTATIPQNLLGVHRFRKNQKTWRELVLPATLRYVWMPVGVATLYALDAFSVGLLRQVVGAVVVFCVLMLILFRPTPREELHVGWTWLTFSCSGFFAGCTGTGGPFMVLWVQAHNWSTERGRAFLFVMYLLTIPVMLGLLFSAFGNRITRSAISALVLIPLLLAVSWSGLKLGSWLGRERLRKVTMVILLVIGVIGLFAPLITRFLGKDPL